MWQAPAEGGGEEAEEEDCAGAGGHGDEFAARPEDGGDEGADNRGAGVEVFDEDVWAFAGEEVANDAAAHARKYPDKNCQIWVAGGHAGANAEHGEDGKSDGVHDKEAFFGFGDVFGDARDKHHQRGDEGRGSIKRIAKNRWRRNIEDEVARDTSANGGGETEDGDAKNIHFFVHGREYPARHKRNRPDDLKNNYKWHTDYMVAPGWGFGNGEGFLKPC